MDDIYATFKDRITGCNVTARAAFGCLMTFSTGRDVYKAKRVMYIAQEFNPRYLTVGHLLSLEPDIDKRFSLPVRDLDTLIKKLRTLADIAGITHNIPAGVRLCRTGNAGGPPAIADVPSLMLPAPPPPLALLSPPSTPSPKKDGQGVHLGGAPDHRVSQVISIQATKHGMLFESDPQPVGLIPELPPTPPVVTPRAKTPLYRIDLASTSEIQSRTGVPRGSPRCSGKQPAWIWNELQKREKTIRSLEDVKSVAMEKLVEMEKEVARANDKALREEANAERMRLNLREAPVDDGPLSPQDDITKLFKSPGLKKMKPLLKKDSKMDPSFTLVKTIRKLVADEGDTGMAGLALDAMKNAIGPVSMHRELKRWSASKATNKLSGDDACAKYADGITEARAPDQIEKLEFYPDNWTPERTVRQTVEDITSWRSPKGIMWPSDTVTDLLGNLSVIERWHSADQPPGLVLPFYTYSLSLFNRVVWATWIASKSQKSCWEVLGAQTDNLEQAFYNVEGKQLKVDPAWFKNMKIAHIEPVLHAVDVNTKWAVNVFKQDKIVLVRFENVHRGDDDLSPLHDSVLWLPVLKPSGGSLFQAPLEQLPPPGLIEYLYSRSTMEELTWAANWSCKRVIGSKPMQLMQKCLDCVDQQKVDSLLVTEYKALIEKDNVLVPQPKKRDCKYPLLIVAVKMILHTRMSDSALMSPQNIAHALDIQKLVIGNTTFCINLASPPFLVVEVKSKSEPTELFRLKNAFEDQIYWHVNAAMRNYQFENNDATLYVQVEGNGVGGDFDGKYIADNPPTAQEAVDMLGQKVKPVQLTRVTPSVPAKKVYFHKKNWVGRLTGNTVTPLRAEYCSFLIGTWVLQQSLPLQYYIDQALGILRAVPTPNSIPHEIVPSAEGIKNYRGLANVILDRRVYDTNKIVLWGQFSSSSLDRGVASAFAKGESTAAVFTLLGRNCVCIAHWSRFARESEWLYPPNTIFKVTNCLAEEHQMILDKANLQLFSMEEVDEYAAIETFLRGMVPLITGDDAPKYVLQLFNVIHCLSKKNTDESLLCLLNPYDQALYTLEGIKVAKRLMKLARGTLTSLDVNLLKAAEVGSSEGIVSLLGLGACIEAKSEMKQTPLQVAACGGHKQAAKVLLNHGANVEANGGGFLPLELAALRRDHVLTDILRDKAPELSGLVPARLEEFQPRVLLPEPPVLKKFIEAADLKWDKARAKHSGRSAKVVLFDRGKELFWLQFDDESTDLYPASVLIKDTEMHLFDHQRPRRPSAMSDVSPKHHRHRPSQAPRRSHRKSSLQCSTSVLSDSSHFLKRTSSGSRNNVPTLLPLTRKVKKKKRKS